MADKRRMLMKKNCQIDKAIVDNCITNVPWCESVFPADSILAHDWGNNVVMIQASIFCTREELNKVEGDLGELLKRKKEMADKKWIQKAIKKPGALHKDLGVPMGKKIPAKKLDKAMKSKNPTIRKRAALAKTLKKMNK